MGEQELGIFHAKEGSFADEEVRSGSEFVLIFCWTWQFSGEAGKQLNAYHVQKTNLVMLLLPVAYRMLRSLPHTATPPGKFGWVL